MLTDYMTTASGYPYDVFMWTTAARLAGCKVRFVGVGVGPIYGRLSRWLITTALSIAELDLQRLIEQFTELEARGDEVKPIIEKKANEYRNLLEEQCELIFGELGRLPAKSIARQFTTRGPRGFHEASR